MSWLVCAFFHARYADGSICFQELKAEISDLEKQRDELEAQLKKVFLCPCTVTYILMRRSLMGRLL